MSRRQARKQARKHEREGAAVWLMDHLSNFAKPRTLVVGAGVALALAGGLAAGVLSTPLFVSGVGLIGLFAGTAYLSEYLMNKHASEWHWLSHFRSARKIRDVLEGKKK